jgi:Outer membrane protein beta-barrel domain
LEIFFKLVNLVEYTACMKKAITIVLTLLLFTQVRSQTQLGIKGGVNISNLILGGNGIAHEADALTRGNLGLLAMIRINHNNFYLQQELIYSGQGAYFPEFNASIHYQYLNLPTLLKYRHPTGFFAETGSQFGFLLSTFVSDGGKMLSHDPLTVDFGWVFGMGYQIPKGHWGIDLRYIAGNVVDINSSNNFENFTNSVFQFDIMYTFSKR